MSSHKAHEISTTVGCPSGQAPTLQRTNAYSSNIQIILLSILLAIVVIYFIYIRFIASSLSDTVFVRYAEFFTKAYGNITITFIIGLLAWTLVSEFVTDIISPIVEAALPDYGSWYNDILLKTYYSTTNSSGLTQPETVNVLMKPGPFLITFISFIISVILVFFVAEIIYRISEIPFIGLITKYIAYITIFGLILFFLIWSILDRDTINQVTVCSPVNSPVNVNVNTNQQVNNNNLITTAAAFTNNLTNGPTTAATNNIIQTAEAFVNNVAGLTPTINGPPTFLKSMPTRDQKPPITSMIYQP